MDFIEGDAVDVQGLKKLIGQVICLESLEKKITSLRVYDALPFDQIAKTTGLSERSVKIILKNVVKKIRGNKKEIKGGY